MFSKAATCSTLRRVEPHATSTCTSSVSMVPALAVPSDGSNLMQPKDGGGFAATVSPCSTFRRVEPHATTLTAARNAATAYLAVPSDGSNLMQPPAYNVTRDIPSLAVPSDGSNLMQHSIAQIQVAMYSHLQYPQTGRTSCNVRRTRLLSTPT